MDTIQAALAAIDRAKNQQEITHDDVSMYDEYRRSRRTKMTDSPMMQDVDRQTVEALKLVIAALERDKKFLQNEIDTQKMQLTTVHEIIDQGDKVDFCIQCGVFFAADRSCDCIPAW